VTRCHNEPEHPSEGLAWVDPASFPSPIGSDRVVVRPLELGDARALFELVNASRGHLLPWLSWAHEAHRDLNATMHFVATQAMNAEKPLTRDGIGVVVVERATRGLLGMTGLHDLRRDSASCEIGYWLRHDRWGEGLMTEAVRAWISALLRPQDRGGFGLARIRIYCSASNERSVRIPERLGLRAEVHQPRDCFVRGVGLTDRLGWGVLADEWDWESGRIRPGASA